MKDEKKAWAKRDHVEDNKHLASIAESTIELSMRLKHSRKINRDLTHSFYGLFSDRNMKENKPNTSVEVVSWE